MDKIRILNVDILNITLKQLLERLHEGVVVTPNVTHMLLAQNDREFYHAYQIADWVICDSRVLQLFSKLLPKPIIEAIPGSSFFTEFYHYHRNDPNCRIFILGGKEGVAQKALKNINREIGHQIVVGAHSPSFHIDDEETKEIAKIINESGATIVLTGLGAPKQEKFIIKAKSLMPGVKVWMALGATVDFEAGTLKRAPMVWRKYRLEWLYRFIQEPRRLFRRYFIIDIKFFWYFGKQLMGIYKNPFEKQK